MKRAAARSLTFAAVPLALAVLTDLLLWVFYQGATRSELRDQGVLHGVLFLSVFVLATIGSFIPFFLWRSFEIKVRAVLVGAVLFSVATFFASMPAFAFGGLLGLGAWLLFGAALFAAATCRWGRADAG